LSGDRSPLDAPRKTSATTVIQDLQKEVEAARSREEKWQKHCKKLERENAELRGKAVKSDLSVVADILGDTLGDGTERDRFFRHCHTRDFPIFPVKGDVYVSEGEYFTVSKRAMNHDTGVVYLFVGPAWQDTVRGASVHTTERLRDYLENSPLWEKE